MLCAEDLDERAMMSHLPEGSVWDVTVCRRGWKWWRVKEGGRKHASPETPKGVLFTVCFELGACRF